MKYIIDDDWIRKLKLFHIDDNDMGGRAFIDALTPVPELPVKPWEDRKKLWPFEKDNMINEIAELRALCHSQAENIVDFEKYVFANEIEHFREKGWIITPPNPASAEKE